MTRAEADPDRSLTEFTLGSGVTGYLAIDSRIRGCARGGLRMVPDVSRPEIRAAARAMTLKYGFLGLPQGGAKAALLADGELPGPEKTRLLAEFARALGPLLSDRVFVPDADMGTEAADIRAMVSAAGLPVGRREWRSDRSGHYTAVSCLATAEAALRTRGESLAGKRVAVEGFGSVGAPLAGLLAARGAIVVAISTSRGALHSEKGLDLNHLNRLAQNLGSAVVEEYGEADHLDCGALLELPVDLLLPCARFHSLDRHNAARVQARTICAGANDPLSPEAELALADRGVRLPPDFISNSGGVLGGTLEFAGVPTARIEALIQQHVGTAVESLLVQADRQGALPRELAEPAALERHEQVRLASENRNLIRWMFSHALDAYRRGWVPRPIVARLAPAYVERLLGTDGER